MVLINQYSMLWFGVIILGVGVFLIVRKGYKPKDGLLLLGLAAILLVAWMFLRPQKATTNEYVQFQVELGQGQAVLLELQSPY
jgi:preprotein translocase subunit YajC